MWYISFIVKLFIRRNLMELARSLQKWSHLRTISRHVKHVIGIHQRVTIFESSGGLSWSVQLSSVLESFRLSSFVACSKLLEETRLGHNLKHYKSDCFRCYASLCGWIILCVKLGTLNTYYLSCVEFNFQLICTVMVVKHVIAKFSKFVDPTSHVVSGLVWEEEKFSSSVDLLLCEMRL